MPAITRVGELMHRGLVTCRRETPLGEVAGLLVEHRVHALVVVDDGAPVGVISDSDMLAGEWLAKDDDDVRLLTPLTAGELMTSPPETIAAEETVAAAAHRLVEDGVSRLLVDGEDGRAVGVVSVSDLLAGLGRLSGARGRVYDVMEHGFVACRTGTPVAAAARVMAERRCRSLIVLGSASATVGIVTGRALLRAVAGDALAAEPVDRFLTEAVTIGPAAPLGEAAATMVERELNRLVVIVEDDPLPIGTISSWDVVSEMAASPLWRPHGAAADRNRG